MHPFHSVNLETLVAHHPGAATGGFGLADIVGMVTVLLVPIGLIALAALLARRQEPSDDGDGDSGWGRGPSGWGRGGPGNPPLPGDGSLQPGGDPAWWPEFERQFAAYVGQPVARSHRLVPVECPPHKQAVRAG